MRSQLQKHPLTRERLAARLKDGGGGSPPAPSGGEADGALYGVAQRANAGPHAGSLAGLQSVAQRAALAGNPVAQRILRIGNKNFEKEAAIREAVPKSATRLQVDRLVEMGAEGERYKYDSWRDAISVLPEELDVADDYEEDDPEWQTNENRLANLDNVVREWAKRAGGHDSSGHGAGKKISSGNSKDRHQHGQKRKVQHRANKVGSLESALVMFAKAGGTAGDLEASTRKLLGKSNVKWTTILDDAVTDEEL
jgi:hypothetical protein